ncbi:antiviral reverse transcriptase Drt3b [Gilvimarinus sp. F26214L]|uniref:antiviral reverse transcriptase Drt3b n=1 Tax=Gilvimarinus sp. DZF01 TaxID=3461371 RepID=UPI0040466DA9
MSRKFIQTDKKDYLRALLTDTSPYETPLIFSNYGLYTNIESWQNSENIDSCLATICEAIFEKRTYTKPYLYKINKGGGSLRTLSLIHPASQLSYAEFYRRYASLVCFYCAESKTSIRAPIKIGNKYYIPRYHAALAKYRRDKIDTLVDDHTSRFSTSYFAYSNYSRLHKFIESHEYIKLESRYPFMMMLDISRCFDSVYTHSITWATKNKNFAKEIKTRDSAFGNQFDKVISRSNDGETNGIPIGPEFSRVFAEIILESVDQAVMKRVAGLGWTLGKDYLIRRYVDDYFLYSNTKEIEKCVAGVVTDTLGDYKLTINGSKTENYIRPFQTPRSTLMKKMSDELSHLFSRILTTREDNSTFPKHVHRKGGVSRDFIARVKGICKDYEQPYSAVGPYAISAIFSRIVKLVGSSELKKEGIEGGEYQRVFEVLCEIAFFFYAVAPLVSASYQIGKILVLTTRFFEVNAADSADSVKQFIYDKCVRILNAPGFVAPDYVHNHITLEKINLLVAMAELGRDYAVPQEFIETKVVGSKELGYFEIISLLFYIKGESEYRNVREKLEIRVLELLDRVEDVEEDSAKAHLFLDVIACPYVSEALRKQLLQKFRSANGLGALSPAELSKEAEQHLEHSWFVNWRKIDLLNALEKKELKPSY